MRPACLILSLFLLAAVPSRAADPADVQGEKTAGAAPTSPGMWRSLTSFDLEGFLKAAKAYIKEAASALGTPSSDGALPQAPALPEGLANKTRGAGGEAGKALEGVVGKIMEPLEGDLVKDPGKAVSGIESMHKTVRADLEKASRFNEAQAKKVLGLMKSGSSSKPRLKATHGRPEGLDFQDRSKLAPMKPRGKD